MKWFQHSRRLIVTSIAQAALTKHDLADLINVAIEELVHHHYELPVFNTLAVAAKRVRHRINHRFYRQFTTSLQPEQLICLDSLFETNPLNGRTPWNALKQDPGRPILKNLTALVTRLRWLEEINVGKTILAQIPSVKVQQFAAEAKTLDAARFKTLETNKYYTLAAATVMVETAKTLDDIGEMFVKRMLKIHNQGEAALKAYRLEHLARTDRLITTLRDVVIAYQSEGEVSQRFSEIDEVIGSNSDEILSECEAHIAYSGNNYYPFLWQFYKSHRATLFGILGWVKLSSTTQDTSLEKAIQFLVANRNNRKDWLNLVNSEGSEKNELSLNLDFIPPKWWFLVTNQKHRSSYPSRLHRKHFEVCVFSQIMWELKSGDLYIEGSDAFADYRQQQISEQEYDQMVEEYGQLVNLPIEGKAFVNHVKNWLEKIALDTDLAFPHNQSVHLEDGKPVVKKRKKVVNQEKLNLMVALAIIMCRILILLYFPILFLVEYGKLSLLLMDY